MVEGVRERTEERRAARVAVVEERIAWEGAVDRRGVMALVKEDFRKELLEACAIGNL